MDLRDVEFLDSTGLGVLVAGLNRALDLDGTLSLVCTRKSTLTLLRITGLDQVFAVTATVEAALTG